MDREVVQFVAAAAPRAAQELSSLVPFLKEHGEGAKDDPIIHVIASAICEVGSIRQTAFGQYPDLKDEFGARVRKYGRSSY